MNPTAEKELYRGESINIVWERPLMDLGVSVGGGFHVDSPRHPNAIAAANSNTSIDGNVLIDAASIGLRRGR